MTEPDPGNYAWWLAARSAGLVAFFLIATSVIIGLYLASNLSRRPGLKRSLVKVHQQVALAGLTAIAAHGVFLLGDKWLKPGITGIAIPFTLGYRPLWTGLGILAGYLALVLGPTFYLRRRIGARRWRLIHRATVLVYLLAVLHSLGSGTDGTSLWLAAMVTVSGAVILVLLTLRYGPKRARPVAAVQGSRPSASHSAGGRATL